MYRLKFYVRAFADGDSYNYCRCSADLLGNGQCNDECNSQACNWDNLDCTIESNDGCYFANPISLGLKTATGTRFNDVNSLNISCNMRITALYIYWSSYLCGFKVEYEDANKVVSSKWHYNYDQTTPSTPSEYHF